MMCEDFECKYCYLDMSSSGSVIKYCGLREEGLNCDCDYCFFNTCADCRAGSRCANKDKSIQYFKEVLKNGEKHKVFII